MSTILEALAVIKGKDETGGAFDAVAQKIGRIARAASALNRDVQKQMNVASTAERQISRLERGSRMIGNGAKMAGGALAAYEGSRAASALAERTKQAAYDRAHEEVRMRSSGMGPKEIEEADNLAADMSAKYKSVSQTEIMHTARNIRAVVGNFEEATKILDPLLQLRVVAMGAHPEHAEELGEDFDKLVKGMEIKGVTQDLGKFNHYIDGMAKALNVFGDTLRPTDYYEMFKYGRAATNALSDDFMLKTAPTLAQELGGSSAGKALSSFYTQMVGGKMSNKAVEAMAQYGLIDDDKVIKTSTGNIKGVKPGGVVGAEYLQPGSTDPYAWVNNVLLPHLAAKGVTDPAKIQEVIAAIASQQTSAQMMSIFATQQARIIKDANLSQGARGKEAAADIQQHDPKIAEKAIGTQLDNYLGNTASPFMPTVTGGMNWLSSGLSYMAGRAKKDPKRSAAELGFFGAMAAALGIDGSASAFSNAGSLFRGEGFAGVRGSMTKTTSMLAPILEIATRTGEIQDHLGAAYHNGPLSRLDELSRMNSNFGWGPARDAGGNIKNPGLLDKWLWGEHDPTAARRSALNDQLEGFGYNRDVTEGRFRDPGSTHWNIDDVRRATGIGSAEPAKAVVEGNATLDTTVTVKAGDGFWATVDQKITNAINAFRSSNTPASGTSGSTGRSMPEAGAPP